MQLFCSSGRRVLALIECVCTFWPKSLLTSARWPPVSGDGREKKGKETRLCSPELHLSRPLCVSVCARLSSAQKRAHRYNCAAPGPPLPIHQTYITIYVSDSIVDKTKMMVACFFFFRSCSRAVVCCTPPPAINTRHTVHGYVYCPHSPMIASFWTIFLNYEI